MKKVINLCVMAVLALTTGLFASCSSSDKELDTDNSTDKQPVQITKKHDTALLLCSFGSTYQEPQITYDYIIDDFKAAFPNTDIYISFTSRTIVSRVYAQIGKAYAQPDVWFKELAKAGYKKVMVQSLHIIPGGEYVSLMDTEAYKNFMAKNPDIEVARGACLLKSDQDVKQTAKVLYDYYKKDLDQGKVVAFMGHGNPEQEYLFANNRYQQLEKELQALSGKANIFVGTVDWAERMFGHVRDGIIAYAHTQGIQEKEYNKQVVVLAPLMSIAGDHAQNDMLGGLEDGQTLESVDPFEIDADEKGEPCAEFTWKLKLEKLGFTIDPKGSTLGDNFNVVGLGDHAALRNLWVEHLKNAEFETWNGIFND